MFMHKMGLIYGVSFFSLLISTIVSRKPRFYALAMIGMILISVFLSSNFSPHYLSAAEPAFAFGMFTFAILIFQLLRRLNTPGLLMAYSVYVLIFAFQLLLVSESLADKSYRIRKPEYYKLISALSRSPDPLLSLQSVYAVDSEKQLIRDISDVYMRSPDLQSPYTRIDYPELESQACSILLEGRAEWYIPKEIQERWIKQYKTFYKNEMGRILVTGNDHCAK